jgi:hypothetical protein
MTTVTGRLLNHAVYEYDKGVRDLFMITIGDADLAAALARLARAGIGHHVQTVGNGRINLFFGRRAVVDCVRRIVDRPLNELSPHADFMLGTLLGYDRERQCERFLERLAGTDEDEEPQRRETAGGHRRDADRSPAPLCRALPVPVVGASPRVTARGARSFCISPGGDDVAASSAAPSFPV